MRYIVYKCYVCGAYNLKRNNFYYEGMTDKEFKDKLRHLTAWCKHCGKLIYLFDAEANPKTEIKMFETLIEAEEYLNKKKQEIKEVK